MSLGLIGTAPGFVLETDRAPVVVLPGPPTELQQLWPRALETAALREVLARAARPGAAGAAVLRRERVGGREGAGGRGGDGDGVVATICARDFEIHVDLLVDPGAEARGDTVEQGLPSRWRSTCSRATRCASRSSCWSRAGSAGGRWRRPSRARAGWSRDG